MYPFQGSRKSQRACPRDFWEKGGADVCAKSLHAVSSSGLPKRCEELFGKKELPPFCGLPFSGLPKIAAGLPARFLGKRRRRRQCKEFARGFLLRAPKKYRRTFWEEGAAAFLRPPLFRAPENRSGLAREIFGKKEAPTSMQRVCACANSCETRRAPTWLRGQDSNLRPSGYEPDELPNCSTPRYGHPQRCYIIL